MESRVIDSKRKFYRTKSFYYALICLVITILVIVFFSSSSLKAYTSRTEGPMGFGLYQYSTRSFQVLFNGYFRETFRYRLLFDNEVAGSILDIEIEPGYYENYPSLLMTSLSLMSFISLGIGAISWVGIEIHKNSKLYTKKNPRILTGLFILLGWGLGITVLIYFAIFSSRNVGSSFYDEDMTLTPIFYVLIVFYTILLIVSINTINSYKRLNKKPDSDKIEPYKLLSKETKKNRVFIISCISIVVFLVGIVLVSKLPILTYYNYFIDTPTYKLGVFNKFYFIGLLQNRTYSYSYDEILGKLLFEIFGDPNYDLRYNFMPASHPGTKFLISSPILIISGSALSLIGLLFYSWSYLHKNEVSIKRRRILSYLEIGLIIVGGLFGVIGGFLNYQYLTNLVESFSNARLGAGFYWSIIMFSIIFLSGIILIITNILKHVKSKKLEVKI